MSRLLPVGRFVVTSSSPLIFLPHSATPANPAASTCMVLQTELTPEWPPVATHIRRLMRDARRVGAVGQAGDALAAAEEEVGVAGVADRPAAGLLGELEQ